MVIPRSRSISFNIGQSVAKYMSDDNNIQYYAQELKENTYTGKVMNYDLIPKEGIRKPFFIAGGLHSKNIKEITKKVHPYGIDISSGIETDGYKDLKKMKEIMQITGGRHE